MKTVIIAGMLLLGANAVFAVQARDYRNDEYFKAKFGRLSPMEESRLKADAANTAFREETAAKPADQLQFTIENYWKAKFGRSSPAEEARLKAERANIAFREEESANTPLKDTRREEFWKAKLGRTFPAGETH